MKSYVTPDPKKRPVSFDEQEEKPVTFEEDDIPSDMDLCVLCCSKVNPEINGKGLSDSLRVIFLLRNLLQVPDTQLERNLEEWGNPENWIRFCASCNQLIRQAEDLHCEIVKIEGELRRVRKLIVEKARSSSAQECKGDAGGDGLLVDKTNEMISVRIRTREFVSKHVYGSSIALSSPFVEGDSEAKQVEENLVHAQKMTLLYHDDDDDWKPKLLKKRLTSGSGTTRKRQPARHIEMVDGKLKCRYCDRRKGLRFRIRSYCVLIFNTRAGHYDHEVTKHVSKPGQYVCDICGKAWDANKYLLSHRRHVHKLAADGSPVIPKPSKRSPKNLKIEKVNGKFKCRYCDRLLNNKNSHYTHEKTEHFSIPNEFICDICGEAWNTKQKLNSHKHYKHKLRSDGSAVPPKIKPGGGKAGSLFKRSYNRVQNYNHRIKITTAAGNWKCHFCDEEFTALKTRIVHEEEKHVSGDGYFKCEICGKSRETVKRLLQHKRRVHNISWTGKLLPSPPPLPPKVIPKEPQTCELCGKVFTSKMGLTNHLRLIHERRSSWFCHLCGLKSISEHGLVKHMFGKHREEKEEINKLEEKGWRIWRCEVVGCRATYLKERGLERHREKYHRGGNEEGMGEDEETGKRWKCSFCGKGFWKGEKLKRHEEIHRLDGEKPWKCGRCEGAFSTKQYLRDHVRRVHEKNDKDNEDDI